MTNIETIVLGGGCFWCVEAVFQRIRGVTGVTSGYAGGNTENPNYEMVSGGQTGHAEVVKIDFDPEIINLGAILDIFFHLHDPTTSNRQGADVGTQYRSVVLYLVEEQKQVILDSIQEAKLDYQNPIVTEVKALEIFYPAEEYHQNYFNNHPTQGYCQVVINPKIGKLYEKYSDKTLD
jgi:methionine-S-sulfoxide reductase